MPVIPSRNDGEDLTIAQALTRYAERDPRIRRDTFPCDANYVREVPRRLRGSG
jgi:hypothetical protein